MNTENLGRNSGKWSRSIIERREWEMANLFKYGRFSGRFVPDGFQFAGLLLPIFILSHPLPLSLSLSLLFLSLYRQLVPFPEHASNRTFSIRETSLSVHPNDRTPVSTAVCSPYEASGRAKYGFLNGNQGEIFVALVFPITSSLVREQPPFLSLSLSLSFLLSSKVT